MGKEASHSGGRAARRERKPYPYGEDDLIFVYGIFPSSRTRTEYCWYLLPQFVRYHQVPRPGQMVVVRSRVSRDGRMTKRKMPARVTRVERQDSMTYSRFREVAKMGVPMVPSQPVVGVGPMWDWRHLRKG